MKEKIHQVFSVTMALLLLASTTSWTVGKHYCMGRLMNVALFQHADDCGMDMAMDNEEGNSAKSEEDGCCNDEVFAMTGQDDLKTSFNDFNLDRQLFLVALIDSYYHFIQTGPELQVPNHIYPPPLLVKDIQLLDEVFLI